MPDKILVSEIFGPTLQGEGPLIGRPTVFVRTGACDFRCSWCDTPYAVLPEFKGEWLPMTAAEIMLQVRHLTNGQPILVTLSGGNPALQPLEPLLELGHADGYTFALETQGSVARPWFSSLDHVVLSPKPPSSNMETDWDELQRCLAMSSSSAVYFKVVVFDETDYEYAREVHRRFSGVPIYLQAGTPGTIGGPDASECEAQVIGTVVERTEWLLRRVAADGWIDVTILPQLHVLLWGRKRGV